MSYCESYQGRRAPRPIRVLHAVSRMDRVGPETWLMHVLRHMDRRQIQMDFLVHVEKPGRYDAEVRSLGSNLFYGASLRNLWNYDHNVKALLREAAPYDIFHSHLDHFVGYPLKCAARAGIPVRIAHIHTDLARSLSH